MPLENCTRKLKAAICVNLAFSPGLDVARAILLGSVYPGSGLKVDAEVIIRVCKNISFFCACERSDYNILSIRFCL